MNELEEWKDITGYNNFEVSNKGEIRNKINNTIKKQYLRNGYYSTSLYENKVSKTLNIHRIVAIEFLGNFPNKHVNHKDGNKLNNIKENLRLASSSDNCKNCKKNIKNTSGCKGISFRKDINKWSVYINIDKKRKHLGNFSNFIYACVVRKRAEKKYYKQWRCNR